MKFATIALLLFCSVSAISSEVLVVLGVLSLWIAAAGLVSSADFKKGVAFFSVLHMAFGFVALSNTADAFSVGNLGWHHHSAVTGGLFLVVGIAYANSGSRLARFLFSGHQKKPIAALVFLVLITFSLDLP
jgi:NADH:ubiquinone oxidoreductase subunit 4 (subunit M)